MGEWDTQANFGSSNSLPLKGSAVVADMTSKPWAYYITNLPCYDYYVRIYAYNTVGSSAPCDKDGSLCDGTTLAVTTAHLGCRDSENGSRGPAEHQHGGQ